MQDKKRVENFWREPPRGLFIHFVLLIKKRRLKSSQKSLTFWGHYTLVRVSCLNFEPRSRNFLMEEAKRWLLPFLLLRKSILLERKFMRVRKKIGLI